MAATYFCYWCLLTSDPSLIMMALPWWDSVGNRRPKPNSPSDYNTPFKVPGRNIGSTVLMYDE